jgi:hypothetical protein
MYLSETPPIPGGAHLLCLLLIPVNSGLLERGVERLTNIENAIMGCLPSSGK